MRSLRGLSVLVLVAGCTAGDGGGSTETDDLVGLVVEPWEVVIDPATSVQYRATAVTESGRVVPVENVTWAIGPAPEEGNRFAGGGTGTISSSGLYVPAGFGDLSILATADGLSGSAYVNVIPAGTLNLQVSFEPQNGKAPPVAEVRLVGSTSGALGTSASGAFVGEFSGPVDIHISAPDHWPLTVYGLKNKRTAVVLRRKEGFSLPTLSSGGFDFSKAYEVGEGNVRIGIAGSSIAADLIARTFEGFLGPTRDVTIDGSTVEIPENIVIDGVTGPYFTRLELGTLFGLGAEIPAETFASAIAGGSDFSDVLSGLLPEFDSSATRKNFPAGSLALRRSSELATLAVPARPAPATSHLIAGVDLGLDIDTQNGAGFVPVAIASVDGTAATPAVLAVPPLTKAFKNRTYGFLLTSSIAPDQRVAVVSRRHVFSDDIVLPEFLVPAAPASFSGSGGTLTFAYEETPGADFLFHRFSRDVPGEGTLEWDVITPGDSTGFVLPMLLTTNGAQTGATWTVSTGTLEARTYDSLNQYRTHTLPEDTNRLVLTNATVD